MKLEKDFDHMTETHRGFTPKPHPGSRAERTRRKAVAFTGAMIVLVAALLTACSDSGGGRKTKAGKKKKDKVAEKTAPRKTDRKKIKKKPAPVRQDSLLDIYERRSNKARTRKERIALARWSYEKGLKTQAAALSRELLEKEPEDPDLNKWAGNRYFDGEHLDYFGKWLSREKYEAAMKAEKILKAKLDSDPRFRKLHAAARNLKNDYLNDYNVFAVLEWPYVVLIEDFGSKARNDYYGDENRSRVRAFYQYMKKTYPDIVTREPENPFRIIVLKDEKSFHRFNMRVDKKERDPGVRAFFHTISKFIYTYEKTKGATALGREFERGVIFHEATHQFLDFLRPRNNIRDSMWFEEALADFHAGVRIQGRDKDGLPRYVLGKINNTRLLQVKMAIKRKQYFHLSTMFGCKSYDEADQSFVQRFGIHGRGKGLLYCQGWSFIYFCLEGPNPKYRKAMLDYIKRDVGDGDGEYESMIRAFGLASDDQWKPIEREWKAYITKLDVDRSGWKKPRKKKK